MEDNDVCLDEPTKSQPAEPLADICWACGGTGISRFSHRPDDFGPHHVCSTCRGTGDAPAFSDDE